MRRGLSLLVQSFNRRFGPSSSKFRGDNLSLFSCPASRLSICSQLGFLLRFWWRSLFPSSNMVDEATVGIVCFANNAPGFRGILKQRYADFIVNEVDPLGNVVHLTCLDPLEENADDPNKDVVEEESFSSANAEKHIEAFKLLCGDDNAELLRGILNNVIEGKKDECDPIVLAPDSDKIHRTEVHNFFKGRLPFLVTDTVDGPDSHSKCVRVRILNNAGSNKAKRKKDFRGNDGRNKRKKDDHTGPCFDTRGADNWPSQHGKYLQFHLYKENKDTQDALMVIGKMLGLQPKSFGIAGTKDKRAVTTQRVTAFKLQAAKLAALNKRLYGMKVGDFCYVDRSLVLGQLSGNKFTITLRGVVAENDDTIKDAATSFGKSGFINYFGLQRFGTSSVPTFTIGAALFRGEWEQAVNLILQPRDGERQDIMEARDYFAKTKDADGTLLRMPRQFVTERLVLSGLRKSPGNYLQAISSIPRTMRMMYVHSYQSYLWNHAASKRISLFGVDKVVEGDLVLCKDDENDANGTALQKIEALQEEESDIAEVIDGEGDDSNVAVAMDFLQKVKHATAEDVASAKFNISDVVLPIPGARTLLPDNEVADVFVDLAKKDSLDLKASSHNVKEFSFLHLPGGYRRIIQTSKDFDWRILKYSDQTLALAETDWDRVKKNLKVEKKAGDDTQSESLSDEKEKSKLDSSHQTALQIEFTLPSSCYATMAIRELLKISSSVAFHKTLSEEQNEAKEI